MNLVLVYFACSLKACDAITSSNIEFDSLSDASKTFELRFWSSKQRRLKRKVPYCPSDLIANILARLPAKALLRFRCVCAMWRDIIERDEFAMMHLDMYNKNSDNTCMLAIETRFDQVGPGKESVWVVDHGYTLQKITDLTPISSSFKVRASLNGLLLLGTTSIDDKMLLWNPSIRQHITIPPIPSFHLCDACLGLGRNSTSRDYIVLAMIHPWVSGDELPGPVLVYSVRNGCWRTLSCAAPVLCERGQKKCFVSGHIYWLARHYQGRSKKGVMDPGNVFHLMSAKKYSIVLTYHLQTNQLPRGGLLFMKRRMFLSIGFCSVLASL